MCFFNKNIKNAYRLSLSTSLFTLIKKKSKKKIHSAKINRKKNQINLFFKENFSISVISNFVVASNNVIDQSIYIQYIYSSSLSFLI